MTNVSWMAELEAEYRTWALMSQLSVSGGASQPLVDRKSHWSSPARPHTAELMRAALLGRNITITLTGGSSSGAIHGFAYHCGQQLAAVLTAARAKAGSATLAAPCTLGESPPIWRCPVGGADSWQVVEVVPAANGHSGTHFSAILMDALVPRRTDILLWEYAINDWATDDQQGRAQLELWLRRALGLNAKMVLGFAFLWQPRARACWPRCVQPDMMAARLAPLLRRYAPHLDAFSVDFNAIAQRAYADAQATCKNHTTASVVGVGGSDASCSPAAATAASRAITTLFEDKQHPTEAAHAALGMMLFSHLAPHLAPTTSSAKAAEQTEPGASAPLRRLPMPPVSLRGVSDAANAPMAARLMWSMLSRPSGVHSITHSLPRNGDWQQRMSAGQAGAPYAAPATTTEQQQPRTTTMAVDDAPVVSETVVAAAASRSDSQIYARLPLCAASDSTSGAGHVRHTLHLARPRKVEGRAVDGAGGGGDVGGGSDDAHARARLPLPLPRWVGINLVSREGRVLEGPKDVALVAASMRRGTLTLTATFACAASAAAYAGFSSPSQPSHGGHRTACRVPLGVDDLVPGSLQLSEIYQEANNANEIFSRQNNASAAAAAAASRRRHAEKVRGTSADQGTGFRVLLRGLHAPQVWFAMPTPTSAGCGELECARPTSVSVLVCKTANESGHVNGVGAVSFVE